MIIYRRRQVYHIQVYIAGYRRTDPLDHPFLVAQAYLIHEIIDMLLAAQHDRRPPQVLLLESVGYLFDGVIRFLIEVLIFCQSLLAEKQFLLYLDLYAFKDVLAVIADELEVGYHFRQGDHARLPGFRRRTTA